MEKCNVGWKHGELEYIRKLNISGLKYIRSSLSIQNKFTGITISVPITGYLPLSPVLFYIVTWCLLKKKKKKDIRYRIPC